MNDPDRDKFSSTSDLTAGDEEYELEPLDPTVASAEKRRAEQVAEQVRASIDIDDIYRDADRSRGTEIVENWARNFQYRFHIKHLLFATALLAIAIAASALGWLVPLITILVIGSIAGFYLYLKWEDSKQQAEADAKREELYAKRRQQMQSIGKPPATAEQQASVAPAVSLAVPPTVASDRESEPPAPRLASFSLRALFIAMTVAAVCFGMISILGTGPMATILGLIAVAGLVVHALGVAPRQPVIFGWWFILLLYVLLTLANWILA